MILENNNDFQKEGDNKKYIAFRYKNRQWTEYQYGWISLEIDNFNKLIIDSYLFSDSSVKNK